MECVTDPLVSSYNMRQRNRRTHTRSLEFCTKEVILIGFPVKHNKHAERHIETKTEHIQNTDTHRHFQKRGSIFSVAILY